MTPEANDFQTMLAEARKGKDEEEIKTWLCAAYYFIGEKRLMAGDRKGAERAFVETNLYWSDLYLAAKAMLALMKSGRL